MRQLTKISIIFVSAIVLLCSAVYSQPEDFQAQFDEGNGYFLSNQYEEARVTYEGLLDSGYNDPSVYYNLSNTYMLLNMPGKAAVNLYRAKRLQPRSRDIKKNITALNGLLAGDDDSSLADNSGGRGFKGFVRSFDLMSKNELAAAILVLYLIFFIWSLVRKFLRQGLYKILSRILAAVSYIFTMIFIIIFLATFYYESFYPQAVIMQTVELHTSPSEDDNYLSETTLNEGSLVELMRTYNGWGEVSAGDTEITGWVELGLLEKI